MQNKAPVSGSVEHLGERVRPGKYGLKLSRETYLMSSRKHHKPLPKYIVQMWRDENNPLCEDFDETFEDEWWTVYKPEFFEKYKTQALLNYDLNMAFFESLDSSEFNEQMRHVLNSHPKLTQVTDLREWDETEGVYVMILDGYKQAYVGQAQNIRKRIKRHWSGAMPVSKAVFGPMYKSIMSIGSLRALDTTRLLAVKARETQRDKLEEQIESSIDDKFVLNRVRAGRPDSVRLMFMHTEARKRNLLGSNQTH